MNRARLLTLVVILLLGFSSVFALHREHTQPVGIKLALPEYVGEWYGTPGQITDREREVLAADTEFARKRYTNATGDVIFASIVLSGQDLDNSIHRPERCLPAQGMTIIQSSTRSINLPDGHRLPVTRLKDVREVAGANHNPVPVYNLNYYWFVGYHRVTASHIHRELFDMTDRILHGYNQRWAYVTIASDITAGIQRFGRSEQQTDKLIEGFVRDLAPETMEGERDRPIAGNPQ